MTDETPDRPGRDTAPEVGRRIASTAAGAVGALALAAGAFALGIVLPADGAEGVVPAPVAVGAGTTDLVCPGPPRLPTTATGDDIDYDAELGPGPAGVSTDVSAVVLGDPAATLDLLGAEDPAPLTGASAGLDEVTGPALLRAGAIRGRAPLVTARTLARADSGDLRGLASASCAVPSSSIWLVGAGTAVSSSAQLTITNSGDTPARVHLTGWSGTGPAPDIAPVLLAPASSRTVLLEAVWLADRIAIHLESEGGRITAAIQDSRLDGLTPVGLDFVTSAAAPATEILLGPAPLPGYADPDDLDDSDDRDDPGESADAAASVRIVNPNPTPATVDITALGEDGEAEVAGAQDLVVEAGSVTQIPLAARYAGSNGVRLRSDVPITGALELSRPGRAGVDETADPDVAPVDIAWLAAGVPSTSALLAVGAETNETHVLNPGERAARVTLTPILAGGRAGDPFELTVPPASTAAVPTPEKAVLAWRIEATEPVLATTVVTADVTDGRLLTVLPATAGIAGAAEVAVDLRIG
ncbi:hypothetical protein GCG21_02315 [Pseudactinotalea sp. HY160]|uniref:DUF5719 family protein n=1 Tax=Pseudactinotalea sp. HY160 TaxID=2654490 RepID=UPI00128CD262|nr:DUF5719 family protein [Pseudactinotalea sp. HY160]MPV48861.1 hypothetical protein [Pseudactinotalea sp. HY160]